ncbi:MAG: ABC transporter ATP-binding protein [Lachnospiraceae bacterium]|nr:ABC transporter ATP-binding protein [Lachnospiraceae bacterium]
MNDNALLTVQDLQIDFHDHQTPETAVYDFDLTVFPGEIVGIVGESGAGKSLSALAVAGLLKRHSEIRAGNILFEDEDLLHCGREILRSYQGDEIAVIFQEPMSSLDPLMRVGLQVEESLVVHHPEIDAAERKRRALEAIRSVGMEDAERVYSSYPHELSGGMRQRCMIAAAMIAEPKILIADEPTTALDVTVQAQIIELLKRINREKRTAILFISHDLSLVKQLCERVIVMKDGRIVEEGDTLRIFEHPKHAYTRELISAIPRVEKKEKQAKDQDRDLLLAVSGLDAGYGRIPADNEAGKKRLFSLRADGRQILYDVSFSLHAGEILGLAGESGSGKSTLAKTILGMIPKLRGEIRWEKKSGAAMVFQDPYGSLNPAHTVGWILTEALTKGKRRNFPEDEKALHDRLVQSLEQVELPEAFLERRPSELSGGQRQRVAIAEALISNPDVLIADEPVSALDVTVQAQIITLLEKLREETGIAILIIAHDLRVLYRICDRVLIMKKGRIVEQGNVEKIYFDPQQPYTKELLRAAGIRTNGEPDMTNGSRM